MARKRDAHSGGHGWFVTFADLMGLLVSFFVMLVAFSTQDKQKLQILAGSMRDAFGTQTEKRYSGIVEVNGLPTMNRLRNTTQDPADASETPTPEDQQRNPDFGSKDRESRSFALAAASLRQALQDLPEISELSKHIMIEESRQGLNIEIVDQDGRSMFPEGRKEPFDHTRRLIQKLAGPLRAMPNRISITGHTSTTKVVARPSYGPWELSIDRANAVRQILQDEGLPESRIFMAAGKADTQPLFPDDPHIPANRRVTISLMREAPPLPPGFKP
jgi:chemotaxis protein MotB